MVNLELMDMEAVEDGLNKIKPEMIIHCTANVNLEDCQKSQNAAYKLHVEITRRLATHNLKAMLPEMALKSRMNLSKILVPIKSGLVLTCKREIGRTKF